MITFLVGQVGGSGSGSGSGDGEDDDDNNGGSSSSSSKDYSQWMNIPGFYYGTYPASSSSSGSGSSSSSSSGSGSGDGEDLTLEDVLDHIRENGLEIGLRWRLYEDE